MKSIRTGKGMILLYAVFVVFFTTILLTFLFNMMERSIFLTKNTVFETRAYWAAVAGLEYAEFQLNRNIYWPMLGNFKDTDSEYEINTTYFGNNVKIEGRNKKTNDFFTIFFSDTISASKTSGIDSSIAGKDDTLPYSFNNEWYMAKNNNAVNNFAGKRVEVSVAPKHNLFIPGGGKIYVSVKGTSGSRVCNLEKTYTVSALKNRYPLAIYAKDINIDVNNKFIVNETGGRHPAVVCENKFNLVSTSYKLTEDDSEARNLGNMPCFLQDGIVFTDSNKINISGKSFDRADLKTSEKYGIRIEKLLDFMKIKPQIPQVGNVPSISGTDITVITIPYAVALIPAATTPEELKTIVATPPPLGTVEKSALFVGMGEGNVGSTESQIDYGKILQLQGEKDKWEEICATMTKNPRLWPKDDVTESLKYLEDLKKKLAIAKVGVKKYSDGSNEIYYLEKEFAPDSPELSIIASRFAVNGKQIQMNGKLSVRNSLSINGVSGRYGFHMSDDSCISAGGNLIIDRGIEGSGSLSARNIEIRGPVKLNKADSGYVNLYASEDITFNYSQNITTKNDDVMPTWIVTHFLIDAFSRSNSENGIPSADSPSADSFLSEIINGKTLQQVIAVNDFPLDENIRKGFLNNTLKEILKKAYLYSSVSGNNSPEGFVGQVYSNLKKKNVKFNKSDIYPLFNVSAEALNRRDFSDYKILPPTEFKDSKIVLAESSNIKGAICSGRDVNININSGDFAVEGLILCGRTLNESGLDNFIVRYDPALSAIYTNPDEHDYRVSEVLFGKF